MEGLDFGTMLNDEQMESLFSQEEDTQPDEEKEGDDTKNLTKYAKTGSPEYNYLVEKIRERLGLTSLEFNSLENIVKAIGLPKCKLCTHCFDGTSHF